MARVFSGGQILNSKLILPAAVVLCVVALVTWAARTPPSVDRTPSEVLESPTETVQQIDSFMLSRWQS